MEFRFYIDPEIGSPHIYRHNVSEAEVEEVMQHPVEDRPGQHGARVVIGRTSNGRYLRVIYVLSEEAGSIFIITAYEIRGKTLTAFKRRTGKKK